jgi:hypothetical protein
MLIGRKDGVQDVAERRLREPHVRRVVERTKGGGQNTTKSDEKKADA